MSTDRTAPERTARYQQAMRHKGLSRVSLWVPSAQKDEIRQIAARMRESASTQSDRGKHDER